MVRLHTPPLLVSNVGRWMTDSALANKVLACTQKAITPEGEAFLNGRTFVHLKFDDVAEDVETGPKKHHVEAIIAFADTLTDHDRVVVLCDAGVSRSTAAAAIILARAGQVPPADLRSMLPRLCKAEAISPNRLMLRLADEIMGMGGALAGAF